MKITRRNLALIVVLSVLIGLDVASRSGGEEVRQVGALLDGFDPARVHRFELTPPGSEDPIVVERTAPDAPWTLPATFGYPAFPDLIDRVLAHVASLSTLDLVAEDVADHARYGVDASGAFLVLSGAQGEVLAGLVQGKLAPDGAATYVRRVDGSNVYRMPRTKLWPTTIDVFLDMSLIRVPETKAILGFQFEGDLFAAPYAVVHDRAKSFRPWHTPDPDHKVLTTGKVTKALIHINSTFHTGVVAAEALGPDATVLMRLNVDFEGSPSRTLRFGAALPNGQIPVSRDDDPWTVTVDPVTFQLLVDALQAIVGG